MGRYSKLSDRGKSLADVACALVVVGVVAMIVVWVMVGK
jgi:hypothetical protein